jgi:uncharacterized protein (DUF427 family)
MKAVWNNQIIAESDDTLVIEGNHYFPLASVKKDLLKSSDSMTFCPWKGTANYYSIEIDGIENIDAVWYYNEPKELAQGIKNRVAFWKGVEITNS